jgi:hypothetical protein
MYWPRVFRIPMEMTGKALAGWISPEMLSCITGPPAEHDVDGNIIRPLNGELGNIGLAWDDEIPLDIAPLNW